jgi:CMP/dCMP kinase
MTPHPALTVSRTLGSGGARIGYHVAQQLGWRYCDRTILRKTAAELGRSFADLVSQEEHGWCFRDTLLRLMAAVTPEASYSPPLDWPLYGKELFLQESRVMHQLLEQAPAVLVGRGGFIAFRGRPATLHIHVVADVEFRIQRVLQLGKASSRAKAEALLQASDQDRATFIREIAGLDWQDPAHFDLVLDPSRDGFEACETRVLERLAEYGPPI